MFFGVSLGAYFLTHSGLSAAAGSKTPVIHGLFYLGTVIIGVSLLMVAFSDLIVAKTAGHLRRRRGKIRADRFL